MIYDVVMNEESIKVSQTGGVLSVRVMAENNSYLPQGDRYVTLYTAADGQLSHPSQWKEVRSVGGAQFSELEYAYPMQKVWTIEEFMVKVPEDLPLSRLYLIARINDKDGTLSDIPEQGAANIRGEDFWSIIDVGEYLKKKETV